MRLGASIAIFFGIAFGDLGHVGSRLLYPFRMMLFDCCCLWLATMAKFFSTVANFVWPG
jgi:hypothetical protein